MYQFAIDLTIITIERRARLYRNQILTVVVLSLSLIALATALRTAWPSIGLLMLVPLCGAFVWLDTRCVQAWRSSIIAKWARRDIELNALSQAVRAHRGLPPVTLESMLGFIGSAQVAAAELGTSTQTRRAVAEISRLIDAFTYRQLVARVIAFAGAAAGAVWALTVQEWSPLSLAAGVLALPWIGHWFRLLLLSALGQVVLIARTEPDVDVDKFLCLMDSVSLGLAAAEIVVRASLQPDIASARHTS